MKEFSIKFTGFFGENRLFTADDLLKTKALRTGKP